MLTNFRASRILIACGLLLVLTACSGGSDDKTQTFKFEDRPTAVKVFETSRVSCSGECPQYVGGMTTYTEKWDSYYVNVCSVTYIGQNRILANRHCLVSDLVSKGKSCKGRIKFKFPATQSLPAQTLECDQIVDFSDHDVSKDDQVMRPDWSVMTFTGSIARQAPLIETEAGLQHGEKFTAYPVRYALDSSGDYIKVSGVIHKNTCTLNRQSSMQEFFYSAFSSLYSAQGCADKIINGNSGSGIFNTADRLTGVISYASGSSDNIAGGTNGSCIPYLRTPHADCEFKSTPQFMDALENLTYFNRGNEYGDNFRIVNPAFQTPDTHKSYVSGEESAIDISQLIYQAGEEPIFSLPLMDTYKKAMAKFMFYDNVTCIDRKKLPGDNTLYIPALHLKIWKHDSSKIESEKQVLKFKVLETSNEIVALTSDKQFPGAVDAVSKYSELIKKCEKSRKSLFSYMDFSCEALDDWNRDVSQLKLEQSSEVYALALLRNFKLNSMEIRIPLCE